MLIVLILFKDKNITIEDEIDKESEIKQENVVAEHLAAINAISKWWKVVEISLLNISRPSTPFTQRIYLKNIKNKFSYILILNIKT